MLGVRRRWRLPPKQQGAALLMLLLIILLSTAYTVMGTFSATTLKIEQQNKTTEALAQAKEALIGYAASADVSTTGRPGDLPCPDRDNDGKAGTTIPLVSSCGSASGSNQAQRLGRLPWKELGLAELRDADSESLWYAVSNNFKKKTHTALLNSDTNGTITVRDGDGNILYDRSTGSGVVAVIIAPGSPITRQDGLQQERIASNLNNPRHYLDNIMAEDNADFDETGTLNNGFFSGPVRDIDGTVIANDRILVITRDEIMAAIEKRVVAEAFNCLKNYATDPLNQGRLPWAADMATSAAGNYADTVNVSFGRLPDNFSKTVISSGISPMKNGWTTSCNLNLGTWWNNWREEVFYAVADAYKPKPTAPSPSCGSCLTVTPSSIADKRFVVFMAGRRLSGVVTGQPRTSNANKGTIANYLEGENATTADNIFSKKTSSAVFNDYVLYE